MRATRRTVLAWLLAAVIAPPRIEPVPSPSDNPIEVFQWIFERAYGEPVEWDWTWELAKIECDSPVCSIELGTTGAT